MNVKLEAFDDLHGDVILNALAVYAERMREVAAEAYGASAAPEPDPEPEPATTGANGTRAISVRPTANGFAAMARAFGEAADNADAAHKAYETLTGRDNGTDEEILRSGDRS